MGHRLLSGQALSKFIHVFLSKSQNEIYFLFDLKNAKWILYHQKLNVKRGINKIQRIIIVFSLFVKIILKTIKKSLILSKDRVNTLNSLDFVRKFELEQIKFTNKVIIHKYYTNKVIIHKIFFSIITYYTNKVIIHKIFVVSNGR